MRNNRTSCRITIAFYTSFFLVGLSSAAEITIVLNDSPQALVARSADTTITIGDIATVSTSGTHDQRRIGSLDLETISGSKSQTIMRRQIETRLLVDGFRRDQFLVTGPSAIQVTASNVHNITETVERHLAEEIRRQFGLENESVRVRLVDDRAWKKTLARVHSSKTSPTVFLDSKPPIGRRRIDAEFIDKTNHPFTTKLDVQVTIAMNVTLATKRIARGTKIDREMVNTIKRPLMRRSDFASEDLIIGSIAARDIAESEIVLASHIDTRQARRAPIVKREDLLDVVVRLVRGEVRLKNARALSSGNVGDTIAVMNTKTNTRLNAVISSRNVAVVKLPGVRR